MHIFFSLISVYLSKINYNINIFFLLCDIYQIKIKNGCRYKSLPTYNYELLLMSTRTTQATERSGTKFFFFNTKFLFVRVH